MDVYLVEHYLPGRSPETLSASAAQVRAATAAVAAEGRSVRFVRSTIVPGDEAYLTVFEAGSEDDVRAAYARGGVPFARISRAIEADG